MISFLLASLIIIFLGVLLTCYSLLEPPLLWENHQELMIGSNTIKKCMISSFKCHYFRKIESDLVSSVSIYIFWCPYLLCLPYDRGGSPGDVSEDPVRRRSERRVGEWAVTWVKQRKCWRMSCDVVKATAGLENEFWRRWSDGSRVGEWTVT